VKRAVISDLSKALIWPTPGLETTLVKASLLGARSVILVKLDNVSTTSGYIPRYCVRFERLGLLIMAAVKFIDCAAASEAKVASERSLECILACIANGLPPWKDHT